FVANTKQRNRRLGAVDRRENNSGDPEGSSLAVVGTKERKGHGQQPWPVAGAFLRADFRISSRRVVYWFCLAWISPGWILESRVDAGAGDPVPGARRVPGHD
ncbi:hypothetical protein K0M31_009842, partial [Melipona bicolor]